MSNKDINNHSIYEKRSELNLSLKDTMHLFSFSLLKTKSKRTLSDYYNSFKYVFPKDNPKSFSNKNKDSSINNRKISLIDSDNNSSLKTLNIEVPSAEKLSNEDFKNDFMDEYENSFACYCGINKTQFEDIYVKNRYIPIINDFGDITISIKNIVDLLKTYSLSARAGRKILKRNRIKKIFKTQKKKNNLDKSTKNRFLFHVKRFEDMNKININNNTIGNIDMKNLDIINKKSLMNNETEKKDDTKKENYNSNIRPSGFGINIIKHKLIQNKGKILIPKIPNQRLKLSKDSFNNLNTSTLGLGHLAKPNLNLTNNSFFNYNTISNEGNKKFIASNLNNNTVSFGLGFSAIPENKQNISPSTNNIFNFSKNNIQNFQNRNFINTNNLNSNILSNNIINNNNINYHSQISNQLLSPQLTNTLLSPKIFLNDILSPYSPYAPNSNISSPRIISPTFNNNIFQDRFNYNNINGNTFFFNNNSPININNNISLSNLGTNSMSLNNILNNNNVNININNIGNNIINNKKNNNNIILKNNLIDKNINNKDLNNKNILNNNIDDFIRKNSNKNLNINLNMFQ